MKLLWTMVKVALGMIILIPLSLIMLGIVGSVIGVGVAVLRLAVLGLLGYGAFKLLARLFKGPARSAAPRTAPGLSAGDPYYEAAMRELDQVVPRSRSL